MVDKLRVIHPTIPSPSPSVGWKTAQRFHALRAGGSVFCPLLDDGSR